MTAHSTLTIRRGDKGAQVEELQQKLGDYLFSHINELGHLTYKLEPTRGEDPDGDNNMIRTWMATVIGRNPASRCP